MFSLCHTQKTENEHRELHDLGLHRSERNNGCNARDLKAFFLHQIFRRFAACLPNGFAISFQAYEVRKRCKTKKSFGNTEPLQILKVAIFAKGPADANKILRFLSNQFSFLATAASTSRAGLPSKASPPHLSNLEIIYLQ